MPLTPFQHAVDCFMSNRHWTLFVSGNHLLVNAKAIGLCKRRTL